MKRTARKDIKSVQKLGNKYRYAFYCPRCRQSIILLPAYWTAPGKYYRKALIQILSDSWRGEAGFDNSKHIRHVNHAKRTERLGQPDAEAWAARVPMAE